MWHGFGVALALHPSTRCTDDMGLVSGCWVWVWVLFSSGWPGRAIAHFLSYTR